jgi:uncharacterized protein (UPF0261 family)
MTKSIAVLATLDTKGDEAQFIREQLEKLGSRAVLFDIGVINQPTESADITREEIAVAGGKPLADILSNPTREAATPIMAAGTTKILQDLLDAGKIDGAIGFGGLQGTSLCSRVFQQLPYGFPKIIVSTVASGDTSAYVGIKDITMMFSVSDILGLNPFTRKILAKAAGAAHGMAQVQISLQQESSDRPLIGMSNLGVLTQGALEAVKYIHERGYEVIVFHAIGAGGRAMEQMMKEGIIKAVFDYAMGEIADDVFNCLRAGGPERLTVAGKLGIPQVLCPGGAEHLGILVEPNAVPDQWKDHDYVFHSPVVFVPRLRQPEFLKVADDILNRLQHTTGNAVMMLPHGGTGSYAKEGGPLRDPECDKAFFEHLKNNLPDGIEVVDRDTHAEDPAFVRECVDRLIDLIEK